MPPPPQPSSPDPAWAAWRRRARLAAHTHSFRHAGPAGAAFTAAREAGFQRVELWTGHLCSPDPADVAALRAALQAAGLACDAVGLHLFTGAPADRVLLETARAAGAGVVTADLSLPHFPGLLGEVDAMARDTGMKVALHNHGAPHWLGNRAMLAHVLSRCSPAVGVCLDAFWLLDSREDTRRLLGELGPRIHAVHLRDGISLPDRAMVERHLGEGEADLEPILAWMRDEAFEGPVVFEGKDAPERTLPAGLERFQRGPAAFRRDPGVFNAPPPA